MTDQQQPTPDEAGQKPAPAARLEESLRDLVQEEMGITRAAAQRQVPSRADAFWLFLCVADAALLLWLVPDALLSDKRVEILGKLLTWLGGSLFILGYVWFRDLFLASVRHPGFKVVLVLVPVFLIPFYVTQMDIYRVTPVVEPQEAVVEIGGVPMQKDEIKLSLGRHKVVVRLKGRDENGEEKGFVYEREFELRPSDVWRAWWNDERPYWPLQFNVPLNFQTSEGLERIELVKEGRVYDPVFRSAPPQLTYKPSVGERASHAGTWEKDGVILFTWPYESRVPGGFDVKLPYGKYRLIARYAEKAGCESNPELTFMAEPGVEGEDAKSITLERQCTQTQDEE